MIRFRVHDPSGPDGSWSLRWWSLLGPDARPVRGAIARDGDTILCKPADEQPVALALLVDAGSAGRLVLQTCFLPSRDEPYDLFVEVARWLIKQFVEESESWQMWSASLSAEPVAMWEEARAHFRAALRAEDPLEAERCARRSIERGVDAGERLALRHAEHLLGARYARKPAGSATLGVCIDPSVAPTGAAAAAAKQFDLLALRTPWRRIERVEGTRDFEAIDAWVRWAAAAKKPLVIGPIVDFGADALGRPDGLPDFVLAERGDAKRFRELVWNHVREVTHRYQNATRSFIAVGGANHPCWKDEGLERMVELVRTAVVAVRDVRRDAKTVVEIHAPGGESWRGMKGAAWPTSFLQRIVGENLGLSAAGVRFTPGPTGDPARDLMSLAAVLDGFIGRELPVYISGAGIPSAGAVEENGCWRGPWSPERQTAWGRAFVRIAMARPFVEGVWWSRLQDAPGAPADGVLDEKGQPKPVFAKLVGFRKRLSRAGADWRTRETEEAS